VKEKSFFFQIRAAKTRLRNPETMMTIRHINTTQLFSLGIKCLAKLGLYEFIDLAIPSIVNWLNDDIDNGNIAAVLYVTELNQYPGLITIGHCSIEAVDQLESDVKLGRLRYVTSADPEICEKRSNLSLKDCWLGEQFLLYQLSDYRELIPQGENKENQNYIEAIKLPETGSSRFIEWIAETSQKIFCDPFSGYRLCLDSLVTTSRQRLLYDELKKDWTCKN